MKTILLTTLLLISGCAATPRDEFGDRQIPAFGAFTSTPGSRTVTVKIVLEDEARIRAQCWRLNGYHFGVDPPACIERGRTPDRPSIIWSTKPRTWDDPYVCALGHELLHELGADHR